MSSRDYGDFVWELAHPAQRPKEDPHEKELHVHFTRTFWLIFFSGLPVIAVACIVLQATL
jgi:hypothetical protein